MGKSNGTQESELASAAARDLGRVPRAAPRLTTKPPFGWSRKPSPLHSSSPKGLDDFYKLGPDSMPQEGVPHGELQGPHVLPSEVFPGTQHTYWVYVPAQYDAVHPASLMVFQDGQAFIKDDGPLRASARARQSHPSPGDSRDDRRVH